MSPNISFDIQVEIVKRVVRVKSLIRFRSVSKQWKSLIESSEFITQHTLNPTQPHHLLLRYKVSDEFKYVSITDDDDDSFPHHEFSPNRVPATVKLLTDVLEFSCSHGLVCLYTYVNRQKLIVVWNPSISKSISIPVPGGQYIYGFGVCPKTSEPKIVKIACSSSDVAIKLTSAEVFTLRTGVWRTLSSINLLHKLFCIYPKSPVVTDGVIYWVSWDKVTNSIQFISFDLTSEEFEVVDLPNILARLTWLYIFKVKESIFMLDYFRKKLVVWKILKNGVSNTPTFTKLLSHVNLDSHSTLSGFRKNGQLMMERMYKRQDGSWVTKLEVCDPSSEQMNGREIYSVVGSILMMTSYTESLLLLNHSS